MLFYAISIDKEKYKYKNNCCEYVEKRIENLEEKFNMLSKENMELIFKIYMLEGNNKENIWLKQ